MNWISVKKRVPDDRRIVLAWGAWGVMGITQNKGGFIGATRFNLSKDGNGGIFDVEKTSHFTFSIVTHWAEIIGPDQQIDGDQP